MPNITIFNLGTLPLMLPSGLYVDPVAVGSSVTLDVPDTNEFRDDPRIQSLVTGGHIRLEFTAADALAQPLKQYTTATLPAVNTVPAGLAVWNTTERAVYVTNGTSWLPDIAGTSTRFLTAATAIAANRFVGLNTAGLLAVSPVSTERWAGVTEATVALSTQARVKAGGRAEVMPSATIAANNELVAVLGGFAAPFQAAEVSLGTTVIGADASDDITQTNLPATVAIACGAAETGNTIVIYGDVGGTYTKETVTLGAAGSYVSTNTWAAIYCLRMTAAAAGSIDIRDGALVGLLIPQITVADPARYYGAIVPDVSTNSVGHAVQVSANGANATDVVLFGTNFAGAEQAEVVTMNGAAWVTSTLAYRSLTRVFIGADGIAFNAGVTSQYNNQVLRDEKYQIRAYALEAEAVAGATVACLLLPQNDGLVAGEFPAPYHASFETVTGVGATEDITVIGVLATDVIQVTMNSTTAAERILMAAYQAADTVRVTYSGAPGASTFSLLVYRP